jgi:succinate dehydrogenase / fumarate reductase cytochrome b subunit
MAKEKFLSSSIGRKITVGITGLFLISFLVVHVGINLTILLNDNGTVFNEAAHFMSHNWVIRVMEVVLFAGLLIHAGMSMKLHLENRAKRPVAYVKHDGNANSKWYSRSMAILGTLILIFLVLHLGQFWLPTKKAIFTGENEDSFKMVVMVLSNPIIAIIYIAAFFALGYHLLHGFQSAFQTLGLNHKKYTPIIKAAGTAFSVIIPGLFAAIALAIVFGWVG